MKNKKSSVLAVLAISVCFGLLIEGADLTVLWDSTTKVAKPNDLNWTMESLNVSGKLAVGTNNTDIYQQYVVVPPSGVGVAIDSWGNGSAAVVFLNERVIEGLIGVADVDGSYWAHSAASNIVLVAQHGFDISLGSGNYGVSFLSSGRVGVFTTNPLTGFHVEGGSIYAHGNLSDSLFTGNPSADNTNTDIIGGEGYWAIRTGTDHTWNLDVLHLAGFPLTALKISQFGDAVFTNDVEIGGDLSVQGTTTYGFLNTDVMTVNRTITPWDAVTNGVINLAGKDNQWMATNVSCEVTFLGSPTVGQYVSVILENLANTNLNITIPLCFDFNYGWRSNITARASSKSIFTWLYGYSEEWFLLSGGEGDFVRQTGGTVTNLSVTNLMVTGGSIAVSNVTANISASTGYLGRNTVDAYNNVASSAIIFVDLITNKLQKITLTNDVQLWSTNRVASPTVCWTTVEFTASGGSRTVTYGSTWTHYSTNTSFVVPSGKKARITVESAGDAETDVSVAGPLLQSN